MTIESTLAAIRERVEAATPGEWFTYDDGVWIGEPGQADCLIDHFPIWALGRNATFIAHARQDVPRLLAAVEAVLAFHTPSMSTLNMSDEEVASHPQGWCAGCANRLYPCPTVQAVTEALGVEE